MVWSYLVLFAAIVAQAADLGTWLVFQPFELNPIVVEFEAFAIVAKVGLLLYLLWLGTLNIKRFRPVFILAIVYGTFGAWSNLP